ncbi:CIC11C00000001236 [Sungouiella intermedia]|uniref:Complex III subunit 9 n=1 Tax=Sungouiella intermedia TaxID=45354 RepID=A0A1L0DYU4_9ASCO|nr:CIC11C00000001236 [[Candida] intermedia]
MSHLQMLPESVLIFFAHTNIQLSALFKRNSVYVATIFGGAFAFQAFFDTAVTRWYEYHNRGKLWKDLKAKIQAGDEDDEDDE